VSYIGCHSPRRRGIQYAAASRFNHWRLWNAGSPAFAGDDEWGGTDLSTSLRAKRSNPFFLCAAKWIASRSLSSGAHSRDPVARNDGAKYESAFSRRRAPEFCWKRPALEIRGRRESRMRAAPAVSCASCTTESAHEHTGSAENIRPSLRSGFTAYFVLSPVNGLSCHRRHADRSTRLDASIGASGPHDFAVRISRARQSQLSRPPHPTARS
jgi:hypothetical protein